MSVITPFLAYFPCVMLGGSGVIATAIVGFIIGNQYAPRFTPDYRLLAFNLWPTLGFCVQSIVFLLVGIDMNNIINSISSIPLHDLVLYSSSVILTVIIGRFIWVYLFVLFLPRFLFPSIKKKDPPPPWQATFIIAWAGMRGGISLAAALAVPTLPLLSAGANPKSLLIFLVFCVIAATLLLQGLPLPWIIKKIGIQKYAVHEHYNQHIAELTARFKVVKAAVRWLKKYLEEVKDNPDLYQQVKGALREYKMLKTRLKERIKSHDGEALEHDEMEELQEELFVLSQIIEVEREELLRMWRNDEISLAVRNNIMQILDHKVKHLV
jgi:CPA1 family monovalent cation:H+ antiporter